MAKVEPKGSVKRRAEIGTATMDEITARVNKDLGAGSMYRASAIDRSTVGRKLSTGSLGFDLALGGGWPTNKVSEIVGRESAGKTTVVYKTIADAQQEDPEFEAWWAASEDIDLDRAELCGVDLDRLHVLEENVMELVFDELVGVCRRRAADMWVLDSYPQLITMHDDEQTLDGRTVSAAPKLVNYFMRQVVKAMKRNPHDPADRAITGLFINQWRSKITMFGDPRTTPGGEGKNYAFWVRAEVTREDFIKDKDRGHLGQKIGINVFKNKQAPPRDGAEISYYFRDKDELVGAGDYDVADELLNLGLAFDVVTKSSSRYGYGNVTWNGRQGFARAVLEEPALFAVIEADVRSAAAAVEVPARRRREAVAEPVATSRRRRA